MISVIDYIYEGVLNNENPAPDDEKRLDEEIKVRTELEKLLSGEALALFEKYAELLELRYCQLSEDMFQCGFQKGIALLFEAFHSPLPFN